MTRKTDRNLEIWKLRRDGLKLADIGWVFHITKQRVDQIVRDINRRLEQLG